MSGRRRNPLRGNQPAYVAAIAVLSGVLAALAGAAPTGVSAIDWVFVAVAGGAVTWAAATAPWWVVAGACGVATVAAVPQWVLVIVGVEGLALASMVGAQRRNQPWARSLAALAAVQVFARLDPRGFVGLSTLLAAGSLGALFVLGVGRRSSRVRRRTWRILAGVGVVAFAALLGLGTAVAAARGPLTEGNRQARAGLDAVNRGDFDAATEAFRRAADAFERAEEHLGAPWAQPARLLPGVAQNRNAASRLSATGAEAMRAAVDSVSRIDPESVSVRNGRIDIDAIRALEQPFVDLRAAVAALEPEVDAVDSPWLLWPLKDRLIELDGDIDRNLMRADNALQAVRLAPDMLGANGLRRYFVMFTTPAEARGLGGFMGNYAEITVDEGRIQMTEFGRHGDLQRGGPNPRARTLTVAPDVAATFGDYGFFRGTDGTANIDIWENLTMVPDFPTVARFVAELYPQSGGQAIDGVFLLDPEAIAALLSFTGPIEVEGVDKPITSRNVAQFIIEDQYKVERLDERVELLDDIARTTVDRLLSSTLPPPTDLARAFGPLAQELRFMAWSNEPAEQALFAEVGMSGEFPRLDGGDGVAVVLDNAGANKIDAYLTMSADYVASRPDRQGFATGAVGITLTNGSPAGGLPEYAIGNAYELPLGTNRLLVHVYSALGPNGVTTDGQQLEFRVTRVFGWYVTTVTIDIPPGAARSLTFNLQGYLTDPSRAPVTRLQPLVDLPEMTLRRD